MQLQATQRVQLTASPDSLLFWRQYKHQFTIFIIQLTSLNWYKMSQRKKEKEKLFYNEKLFCYEATVTLGL